MISATDLQCAFKDFGGSDSTVVMVDGAAVLKSVHLLPTEGSNSSVQFYDSTDDGDLGDLVLELFSGVYGSTISSGVWVNIPGNGIRFNTGIIAKPYNSAIDGTDSTQTVTILYQGPEVTIS